jgi:DNA replication and repair protein RecF
MNNKKNFPILLLDEIVAHLDNNNKKSLFEELKTLGNQVWMSGSNLKLFSPIINEKNVINLEIEDLLKQ